MICYCQFSVIRLQVYILACGLMKFSELNIAKIDQIHPIRKTLSFTLKNVSVNQTIPVTYLQCLSCTCLSEIFSGT